MVTAGTASSHSQDPGLREGNRIGIQAARANNEMKRCGRRPEAREHALTPGLLETLAHPT
jgi:hypothetical protein